MIELLCLPLLTSLEHLSATGSCLTMSLLRRHHTWVSNLMSFHGFTVTQNQEWLGSKGTLKTTLFQTPCPSTGPDCSRPVQFWVLNTSRDILPLSPLFLWSMGQNFKTRTSSSRHHRYTNIRNNLKSSLKGALPSRGQRCPG